MIHKKESPSISLAWYEKPNIQQSSIVFAVGIIIALGALFLFLAAHGILPSSPNVISSLGLLADMTGCLALISGIMIMNVSLAMCAEQKHSSFNYDLVVKAEEISYRLLLLRREPQFRRRVIRHMNQKTYVGCFRFLFMNEDAKKWARKDRTILADLQVYPGWEEIAQEHDIPQAWIEAVNRENAGDYLEAEG